MTEQNSRFSLPSTIRAVQTQQKKYVSLFKVGFPILALFLMLLVFFGPQDPGSRVFQLDDAELLSLADYENFEDGISIMENVRFVGVDSNSNPFTVLANYARQKHANSAEIMLEEPVALVTSNTGEKAVLRAKTGVFHRVNQTLMLEEDVSYLNASGQYANADKALLDLNNPFSTPDGRTWQVKALGNVRLKTHEEVASAEEAYFNLDKNLLILNKEVGLKKKNSFLKGEQIEVDLETGASQVVGAPQEKGGSVKKRISGTFVPTDKNKGKQE